MAATTLAGGTVPRRRRDPLPLWVLRSIGAVGLVLAWWLLARVWLDQQHGVPTPFNVLKSIQADGWSFYWPLIENTGRRALYGFAFGNGLALALAFIVLVVPMAERVIMQIGLASYCIPIAALGPILTITLSGEKPVTALTALFILFTTLVGAILGLRSADPLSVDLVRAYGGGSLQQLIRVRLKAALPSTLAALKVSAPTAIVGAIVGEELGGTSNVGLGYAMVASEQAVDVPRTWGIALVAALVGGIGYVLIGLVTRYATPWAKAPTATDGAT